MFDIYISGKSYGLKEDIKRLLPKRKGLKKRWHYNYDFHCWQLTLPNSALSKKYFRLLDDFCTQNHLRLEVFEVLQEKRCMSDFKTTEAFFDYFHKLGYSYSFREKK